MIQYRIKAHKTLEINIVRLVTMQQGVKSILKNKGILPLKKVVSVESQQYQTF